MMRYRTCLAVACVFVGAAVAAAAPPTKHLVLDPRLIESAQGARLVQGTVEKSPRNPLFQADKAWENSLNNLYPNVVFDAGEGRFKLWYKCLLNDKEAIAKMAPPFTVHEQGWFLLYATSGDGAVWEKPALGLVPFDGSSANNIVARDTPNVGVFRDEREPDAGRRYKMVFDQGMGKMKARFSADGIKWGEAVDLVGLEKTGDTHNNAFWDPRQKKYVLISRQFVGERLVYRSTSEDFIRWTQPTLALRSSPSEGKARQTYCMPSFPYGGGYVGFVMMYNATGDRTVDCELAFSTDTVTWTRPFAGQAFIPRGAKGSYDAGCVYAQAGLPVERDGKLMVFYGGSEAVHRGWKRHCLPCLATMRVDGFAAYELEGGKAGVVTTREVVLGEEGVTLSADAAKGKIVATVIDAAGKIVDTSKAFIADATDGRVEWTKPEAVAGMRGKRVRLKIELEGAKLYAIGGVEVLEAGK